MTGQKLKVLAVMGPTASGKSALAMELAEHYGGEIVSCDSVQIYRGLNIGSAKPTPEEMARIPHRMIDIREAEEDYSCADFAADAHLAIAEIASRAKLPILCGGTGLYMDRVLLDTDFAAAGEDAEYRARLSENSNEKLHEMLSQVDKAAADAIHPNNRKRVIRALEIYHTTGIPKTEWDARSQTEASRYDAFRILLGCRREWLYRRIDRRVDEMMERGLEAEAREMLPRLGKTASAAIGYKELAPYLRGEKSREEAVEALKQATRNYAKRQLTWERVHYGAEDENTAILQAEAQTDESIAALIARIDRFLQ